MTTLDPEFLKAFELVAEYDRQRPISSNENRLYYHEDGSIIGLWTSDYPTGSYIVLTDTDLFYKTNSHRLRVINGTLTVVEVSKTVKTILVKSANGQPVVKGHAALALNTNEEYTEIEYYDRKATC